MTALDLHPAAKVAHAQIDVEVDEEMQNEQEANATPNPNRRRVRGIRDDGDEWVRPEAESSRRVRAPRSKKPQPQVDQPTQEESVKAPRRKVRPKLTPTSSTPKEPEARPEPTTPEANKDSASAVSESSSADAEESDQDAVMLEEAQDRREALTERADVRAAQPEELPGSGSVEAQFSVRRIGVLFRGRSLAQGQTLSSRMARQLSLKTYLLAQALDIQDFPRLDKDDGAPVQRGNFKGWSSQYRVQAFLVIQEVGSSLRWTLFSSRGHVLLSDALGLQAPLDRMREADLEKLSDPLVDRIVALFPYRGFVTRVGPGRVRVNLGERHGLRVGDRLQLMSYAGRRFDSPLARVGVVEVDRLIGKTQSEAIVDGRFVVPAYAKVGFQSPSQVSLAAQAMGTGTDWAFTVGGELVSFSGEAAEAKLQSSAFRFNATPFGVLGLSHRKSLLRGHFGSVRSDSETLNLFEAWGLHNLKTWGEDTSALLFSVGVRYFSLQVVSPPGTTPTIKTGSVVSPMLEFRYNRVLSGMVRLFVLGEGFYPLISSGGSGSGIAFAFGGGAGAGAQLSLTPRLAVEVSGRSRYFRRPIEGLSGVYERQNTVGGTLIFRF